MEKWQEIVKAAFEKRVKENVLDVKLTKDVKKPRPLRILIDGKYFITPKGKTVWMGIGPAKNALRAHLLPNSGYVVYSNIMKGDGRVPYKDIYDFDNQIFQEFLDKRVVFEYIN